MNVAATAAAPSGMHDAALSKLQKVLGPDKASVVLTDNLERCGMTRIGTPDDLFRFARTLELQGGIVGTIGALLALHAVMRGASGERA